MDFLPTETRRTISLVEAQANQRLLVTSAKVSVIGSLLAAIAMAVLILHVK
jgi:hypothetical protein